MHAVRKEESPLVERILKAIKLGNMALLMNDARDLLEQVTSDGSAVALQQIGFNDDESITSQLNQYALDYASERSAEMVGMKWVDGDLVPNPNAEWQIEETTREMIRADVAAAIESGASNDKLADTLANSYAFSDERATTIARTETAFADVAGNLEAYKLSGQVERKEWKTAPDCCDECQDLDGVVVSLDDDFPNDGGDGPPLHPNCRCDVLPVLTSNTED